MRNFIYKWLPIFFGCHCRSDRSFFYHGHQFPICARCTGELAGMILMPVLWYVFQQPSIVVCILLMVPLVIDGTVQCFTKYESTNRIRFITGFLFGYAFLSLIVISTIATFRFGYYTGKKVLK